MVTISVVDCLTLQDCVKSLNVQSVPAAAHAVTTLKKQRPMLSSRHTDDDLKSGCYEYITDDSESLSCVLSISLCCCVFHF